jgi:hypothetical protein
MLSLTLKLIDKSQKHDQKLFKELHNLNNFIINPDGEIFGIINAQ